MTKFKAGDKVRCIEGYSELKTGHLYTVSGIAVNDLVELCNFPDGVSWRADRFELVEENKPFGDLTRDEKLTLMAAWVDGNVIEWCIDDDEWQVNAFPAWVSCVQYRVKAPEPIADNIDWSHVREDFKWMSRYSDDCVSALYFASYKQGNLPWDESLICRPGFEDK